MTDNDNIAYQTGTPAINKGDAAVTAAPAGNTPAYAGAARTLVTAGAASAGDMMYSLTETGT